MARFREKGKQCSRLGWPPRASEILSLGLQWALLSGLDIPELQQGLTSDACLGFVCGTLAERDRENYVSLGGNGLLVFRWTQNGVTCSYLTFITHIAAPPAVP